MSGQCLVLLAGLWHFLNMVRIRTLLSSVMALALLSSSASAEELPSPVQVRGSDKGGYSRIVFDWARVPKYTANQTPTGLVITFDAPADFKTSGNGITSIPRISAYKVLSPNSVQIGFAENETIRHFIIDKRLVIDVKDSVQTSSALPPPKTEKIEEPEKKKDSDPVNLVKQIETAAGAPAEPVVEHVVEPAAVDPVTAPVATPVAEEPAKGTVGINITSTESISIAVFKRSGYLWIVESKDGIKIPPQMQGDGAKGFPAFERVSAVGSSVFRVKIPDSVTPVITGGGLVWKMGLQDKAPENSNPLGLKRLYGTEAKDAGPSLLWPATDIERIAEITDPDIGDTLHVALVESAKAFSGEPQHYVDFDTLPSFVGIAISPKSDEIKLSKTPEGLLIGKADGLTISSEKDILGSSKDAPPEPVKTEANQEISRIYDFAHWQIGAKNELSDNQRLIMSGMADQTDAKRTESLIGLARLVLSFNYAPEALGYLDLALNRVPDLDTNPEFVALRGAAGALSWKYKEAFADFSIAGLNDIGEILYWKAFTLAKLDDWQQAAKILPDDVSILATYPDDIRNPVALTLAEVALREGNIDKAKRILDILQPSRAQMLLPFASAFDYLMGEYARQTGKPDEAKRLWTGLTTGLDDLYRAKARFALTMLQLGAKEIAADKAIDNLEGLRYAWRGDDLEVSINYNLAKAYLEKGEPVKALTMMKLAHSLNPTSEQGKKIDADMHDIFKNLFTPDKIKLLSPIDAQTVYNEFADLIPAGAEGEVLARQLAEKLADADLLPRATAMLKKQVDGGLQGLEGAAVAIRLAALQNMDEKPDDALQSLDKAELFLKDLPAADVLPKQRDIGMLRAKAFSMKNKMDDAFASLALLPQDEDTLRLRADIAWRGKKWQDAADSLEQLVQDQEISLTRPLTDEQADLILNWGVALYLADNRYVLANLRERYSDAMAATSKAQKFDVVTRPRQAALLADRDTINSIVDETVVFKDFLKSFKAGDVPASVTPQAIGTPPSTESAQTATPAPAPSATPAQIPESLRNAPDLKTDEVLGD